MGEDKGTGSGERKGSKIGDGKGNVSRKERVSLVEGGKKGPERRLFS